MDIPDWPKVSFYHEPAHLSLTRTSAILAALGSPENSLPPTIHVAGTNGKGSTVAMLASILSEAGYKVDTYTSPHIVSFNERITVAGEKISPYYFQELLDQVRYVCEALSVSPSFFEGITIAAFLAFSKSRSDILLLETGMGGEFDPTNIVKSPLLTVITTISYDHTNVLGSDLFSIAKAKAGIIKQNVPCVIAKAL